MYYKYYFRVWDKINKKMLFPDNNGTFHSDEHTPFTLDGRGSLWCIHECVEKDDSLILLQSSNVKFGNAGVGKYAFKGDVVENICTRERYEIVYSDGAFCLQGITESYLQPICNNRDINCGQYYICGNIFENTKLLTNNK